jgi:hypothetical protein
LQPSRLLRDALRRGDDRADAVLVGEPGRLQAVIRLIVASGLVRCDVMPCDLDARAAGAPRLVGKPVEIVPRLRLPYVNRDVLNH